MWAWGECVRGGSDAMPAGRGLVWAHPMLCDACMERVEPELETTPPLCLGGLLTRSGIG